MNTVDERLNALQIKLPEIPPPVKNRQQTKENDLAPSQVLDTGWLPWQQFRNNYRRLGA